MVFSRLHAQFLSDVRHDSTKGTISPASIFRDFAPIPDHRGSKHRSSVMVIFGSSDFNGFRHRIRLDLLSYTLDDFPLVGAGAGHLLQLVQGIKAIRFSVQIKTPYQFTESIHVVLSCTGPKVSFDQLLQNVTKFMVVGKVTQKADICRMLLKTV
jgi:hypothetical protein